MTDHNSPTGPMRVDPTAPLYPAARPVQPTPAHLAAGLPDGYDDPASPWFVPEDARAAYLEDPPNVTDWVESRSDVILPPSSIVPERVSMRGQPMGTSYTPEQVEALSVYTTPAMKAHHRALTRATARVAADAERERREAQWAAATVCTVCGELGSAMGRRVIALPATIGGVSPIALEAQACNRCAPALALAYLEACAAETPGRGKSRRELARDWLRARS